MSLPGDGNRGGEPARILFVFAWLAAGEEVDVGLLARTLDPALYKFDIVACFHKPEVKEPAFRQLEACGVDVDTTPYELSFEETVAYLATKIPNYDIVVSCQDVADIYPALERLHHRPPLIEHGTRVSQALAGPKHFTARYVGANGSTRDAAAGRMIGHPWDVVEIPFLVDCDAFASAPTARLRHRLAIPPQAPVLGWVGETDAPAQIENFMEAAALVVQSRPQARFLVAGTPNRFGPGSAEALRELARKAGIQSAVHVLAQVDDLASVLAALDLAVCPAAGKGINRSVAEAGAAGRAVIPVGQGASTAHTNDCDCVLQVSEERPEDLAAAMIRLIDDPPLRDRLGAALQQQVRAHHGAAAVVPQWQSLFDAVLFDRKPAAAPTIFRSFLQGGFECSTHRRGCVERVRLDLADATGHSANVLNDYGQLREHRIRTVRDGLRWHLVEQSPGRYDWSSFLPMLRAARDTGTQVIWDLQHYGWPDDLDIWTPAFVERFARFARAAAELVRNETDDVPFYCPVNEPSFFSWAGGDVAYLNPFARGRGLELKVQMVRAAIAAMHAVLEVEPRARFVHCDPAINVVPAGKAVEDRRGAHGWHEAQYQAWDMIAGLSWPQLGGEARFLDVVGVNYYFDNQWVYGAGRIDETDPRYKRFRRVLTEVYARYGRPIMVAETGTEGDRRADWMRMILAETEAARAIGVPVEGICLYPVVNHVGWDDGRNCPSGLLSLEITEGRRSAHLPLAEVLAQSTL